MVKSIVSILISSVLLLGLAFWEWTSVSGEFESFHEELTSLYHKIDEKTANTEDAKAVQTTWDSKKQRLHIWIPHNDITKIDDYLSETIRLIGEKNLSLALSKVEILIHLSRCLPDTYRPALENIL